MFTKINLCIKMELHHFLALHAKKKEVFEKRKTTTKVTCTQVEMKMLWEGMGEKNLEKKSFFSPRGSVDSRKKKSRVVVTK